MKYEVIWSQVARNMGWAGYKDQYFADMKFATYWSMMELAGESLSQNTDIDIPLKDTQTKYIMPSDFHIPKGVIILDTSGAACQSRELEYDEIKTYSYTTDNVDLTARYLNDILFAFRKAGEVVELFIYPNINGIAKISYDAIISDNFEYSPESEPPLHHRFHTHIVDGASYYLERRNMQKVSEKGDPLAMQAYISMLQQLEKKFEEGKQKYASFSGKRSTPPIVKPFQFYEIPEDYQ